MTIDNALTERFPELKNLLHDSELLREVARERNRTRTGSPPSVETIAMLETRGCRAEDWSRVRLATDFDPARVSGTTFYGDVDLGRFAAAEVDAGDGVALPAGVYNSVLMNCSIGDDCLISGVGTISRVSVAPRAVIVNTRVVSCSPEGTRFGNGADVIVGIETTGREVKWFAEISLPLAAAIARERGNTDFQKAYAAFVEEYVKAVQCSRTLIGEGARISSSGRIVNCYIGPYAVVDNAAKVENSTVLSGREEPALILDSTYVNAACVQWGCRIASASQVDRSVLCETAGTDRHGRVLHSIIGPNTNIAGGEVTASLLGPFVGFHHQALLIATFWPEGRGNVAYGANVGSNHTSKAPDQELWPGAGVFFGLGVNVKFPANLTRAPYSIVATAVDMLPQAIEFPFSLINPPSKLLEGISPALNEIMPAWVLSDQIYAVLRNEQKCRERNRARRTPINCEVFTPEVVDLMIEARSRLADVHEKRSVYTEREISGLGKNFMLESSRETAIEAYTFYICTYALQGLKNRIEKVLAEDPSSAVQRVLGERSSDPRWEHERGILAREYAGHNAAELLSRLVRHQERIAKDVQLSKEKDDTRGRRIIPDYEDAHSLAKDDLFVCELRHRASEQAREVEALLSRFPQINQIVL